QVEIAFAEERIGIINNAVLRFPRQHPAIAQLLAYISTVDAKEAQWGSTGPLALTRIFNECGLTTTFGIQDFYPLHWKETPKLLFPEFFDEVQEKISSAPFVHLWGSTLREIGFNYTRPIEGSYMHYLNTKYMDSEVATQLQDVDEGDFRKAVKDYVSGAWHVDWPIKQ
ncbi:MAG: hypothetical protein ABIR26_13450, partial [Ramlibacter sp.]